MSRLAQIRDAIVAAMQGVADIGCVHDYERYAREESKFREIYLAEIGGVQMVRGWYVRRMRTRRTSPAIGVELCAIEWRLVGYQGLDDAAMSEKTFDERVEALADAFSADATLGGVVGDLRDLTTDDAGAPYGLQVEDSGHVQLAGRLCHRVQCVLVTSHARRI